MPKILEVIRILKLELTSLYAELKPELYRYSIPAEPYFIEPLSH